MRINNGGEAYPMHGLTGESCVAFFAGPCKSLAPDKYGHLLMIAHAEQDRLMQMCGVRRPQSLLHTSDSDS